MKNVTKIKSTLEIERELHEVFSFIDIIGEYTGANNKILHRCNLCGHEWEAVTRSVKASKHGCPKCQVNKARKELSLKNFLDKLDKDKYELVDFQDQQHVKVKCKDCGNVRETTSSNILRFGCKHCSSKRNNELRKLTKDEFVSRASIIHRNKYDYSKAEYINFNTKLCIICPTHGEFWQSPNKHLSGQECPKCAFRKNWTTEEFIQHAKEIHGDKYDYSKTEFSQWKDRVTIICPKHGYFEQLPSVHIDFKCGCPFCKESHGKAFVNKILQSLSIPFVRQKVIRNNHRLFKVDFYLELNNKIFIIEYNGRQHYFPIVHFGGEESFIKQCVRDEELRTLCKENNYCLLELPYNKNDSEVEEMIKSFLVPSLQECNRLSQGNNGESCDANPVINSEITKGSESS